MLDIGPALSISGYRENIRRFASTGKKILRIYLHMCLLFYCILNSIFGNMTKKIMLT